jgi:hypothetical protein
VSYLRSESIDSLLSIGPGTFDKRYVVSNSSIEDDGITEEFHIVDKFGDTMEL